MSAPEIFTLARGERESSLWQRLLPKLEAMLKSARERNDQPLPENMTAQIRGEIGVLKALIALNEDRLPYDG